MAVKLLDSAEGFLLFPDDPHLRAQEKSPICCEIIKEDANVELGAVQTSVGLVDLET